METNLFLLASRAKYRFPSNRGELTVENLWDLHLTSKSGCDLDTIAKSINRELKGMEEESFVETNSNPRRTVLKNKLEIVKEIIEIKQEERKAAQDRVVKQVLRDKLQERLTAKQDAKLDEMSEEELIAQLAALN